jgi:hypothetical protein
MIAGISIAALLAANGWWESFGNSIRQKLGPAIKALHQPIDDWLGSLPMSVAMICTIGLFMLAGIWIWTLRTEFIFRGAPCRRWWCDLRIWATLLLLPYIGVYLMLG